MSTAHFTTQLALSKALFCAFRLKVPTLWADAMWEDMTAPLDLIARRLYNFETELGALKEHAHGMLEAELIVEFAEEHGLRTEEDTQASALRDEFMQRVNEWIGCCRTPSSLACAEQPSADTQLSSHTFRLSMVRITKTSRLASSVMRRMHGQMRWEA